MTERSTTFHGSAFLRGGDSTGVSGMSQLGPVVTFGSLSIHFCDLDRHGLAAELRRLADDLDPQKARPTWDDFMRDETLRLLDRQWGAA